MINCGETLVRDINSAVTGRGEAALWWMGQHSFILKAGGKVIYIDPYLTDKEKRLVPPLLEPAHLANADLILGTHDHSDHIDRPALKAVSAAAPRAPIVIPRARLEAVSIASEVPAERFHGLNDMESVSFGDIKITAVASAHEFLSRDEVTGLYPFLGYVIEADGFTAYHSGDCCVYEGLLSALKNWSFDLVMLPINGRDAVRYAANCIGNMTWQEAADLAGALGARHAVPAHFDMFAGNRENPQLFIDYINVKHKNVKAFICGYGRKYMILPAGR